MLVRVPLLVGVVVDILTQSAGVFVELTATEWFPKLLRLKFIVFKSKTSLLLFLARYPVFVVMLEENASLITVFKSSTN